MATGYSWGYVAGKGLKVGILAVAGGSLLPIIGFTAGGIAAGSIASSMMTATAVTTAAGTTGVVAGGVVATLQAAGATGALMIPGALAGAVTGLIT